MTKGFFITGTDTGVGKTLVAAALMQGLQARACAVAGMKPVASGAELSPEGWRNADALRLQAAASIRLPYATVSPYTFAPAVAPHIAAQLAGTNIEIEIIEAAYRQCAAAAPIVVVEGAGGWRLPLGGGRFLSDFAERQKLDVVLVVGLRLGCLNHARLTAEAIQRGRCTLVGWVGNRIDPDFACAEDNIATLRTLLDAPCLGVVPYLCAADLDMPPQLDWTPVFARMSGEKFFSGA